MSIVLGEEQRKRTLSRRSLSNGASSRHLNRKDTEVSVISVEARRSQLEIMAAATGINSNNTDMDGQESSLHLSEEALESMRRDYVRKLSLEILSSTTHDTRTELHCDVLLELLKDDAFFKDLSDSVRRELCRVMGYKNLAPDMAVFRRGDPGDNFYVILSGSVAVYADEIEGMPLAELREGQGFGEMALAHDAPRNATIVTRDQTELLFIPKNEYRSILRKLQFKEYNEKTSCFKSLPHFRHWDNYALMGLSKVCKLITEPANKLMCRQGDVVSHIYIVKKGRCRLIKEIAVPRVKCRLGDAAKTGVARGGGGGSLEDAQALLDRVATTVEPLMKRHSWFVEKLQEMMPRKEGLLGMNVNRGAKILLKLRQGGGFMPFEQILDTMLHELVHMEIGPHNASFYKMWDELRSECERDFVSGAFTVANRGRDADDGEALHGLSAKERALRAAERRRQQQSTCIAIADGQDQDVALDDDPDLQVVEKPPSTTVDDAAHAEQRLAQKCPFGGAYSVV
ncbi:cAMP-dependent protein kinase regulatory subunit [Hondaea fermentalgiana]|uniref:cAMP-dependent protein kinase regulatory subunit n=1 Tax=Hondaea fermentalgiana TaxID=2315210 RepID=A0A2R5GST1_9STRA|nr:cAMP-dependent protein kinase regulatory subunit [Hondaea fermentalgiana]|eukprot:GBG33369.1 cAMP-dependent protein kinase regulatory subunit [Hondaea fermentalgiana]